MNILSAEEWTALCLSLKVAGVATLVSLPGALLAAWLLARCRFPGKALFDALVHLPLVLPPVVTGYALLVIFGRNGWAGAMLAQYFGIVFAFRWTGAAIACAVMGFPLMVRAIRLAIEAVDPKLEAAASTLGANRLATFMSVTLPLALPGVLAGMVLAFAKALGEFGATITFVSNIPGQTQTLSSAIYTALQDPAGSGAVVRLTIVSVILALAALIASEALARHMRRQHAGS